MQVTKIVYSRSMSILPHTFEYVDICDFSKLKKVFQKHKLDLVMHLAESHVDRSIEGPAFIRPNEHNRGHSICWNVNVAIMLA